MGRLGHGWGTWARAGFQSWVWRYEQLGSLGGDEVRREESSWVEAVPRELSDSLSTSWLRGEDGHLWTVTKSLLGALLLDLQTSELWKLQTCHWSHLDYDIFATLVIARSQKCLSRKDCARWREVRCMRCTGQTEPWKDPEFALILDSRPCFATINLGTNLKKKLMLLWAEASQWFWLKGICGTW